MTNNIHHLIGPLKPTNNIMLKQYGETIKVTGQGTVKYFIEDNDVQIRLSQYVNLGLSFIRVVGAYKIYTQFVPWKIPQNYHSFCLTLYIDSCLLFTKLLDSIIFICCDLCRVYKIIGVASPLLNPVQEGRKNACFMYLAS